MHAEPGPNIVWTKNKMARDLDSCDFSVSPSPSRLEFGTLDVGTSDSGLTIYKYITSSSTESEVPKSQIQDEKDLG